MERSMRSDRACPWSVALFQASDAKGWTAWPRWQLKVGVRGMRAERRDRSSLWWEESPRRAQVRELVLEFRIVDTSEGIEESWCRGNGRGAVRLMKRRSHNIKGWCGKERSKP